MREKLVPGTTMPYAGFTGSMFSLFRPMIQATDGLSLGQVCSLCGLEISTVQNWVKRGYVPHTVKKKYYERHLARILIISALRDCMQIEDIAALLKAINGDTDSEEDDIISEPQLYDFLCETIRQSDRIGLPDESTAQIIEEIIRSYVPPTPEAARKIRYGLLTMVCAYTAGRLKEEADLYFNVLRGGRKE